MMSQASSIGGTSNQLRLEKECGGNFPSFWGEFCKTLPSQNGIFLTFQNCGIWTFHIFVFVNTTPMVVSYSTLFGPVDLSSDVTPKYRHLVAKSSTMSGQLDILSAFGSG